jgi:hypothetical protein
MLRSNLPGLAGHFTPKFCVAQYERNVKFFLEIRNSGQI